MTTALRKQILKPSLPQVTFGPLRFLEALPWLVMAAAMRVIAFGGGAVALPATMVAAIAVLHAFLVVAQRSIELNDGQTGIGELDFSEQFRLSREVLWRIGLLMLGAVCAVRVAGYTSFAPNMMGGLDGMAFDQWTDIGKFWSALIAALVLLMIVDAEQNRGEVSFAARSRRIRPAGPVDRRCRHRTRRGLSRARPLPGMGAEPDLEISGRYRRRASSSRT